jgi:hypothetical protein
MGITYRGHITCSVLNSLDTAERGGVVRSALEGTISDGHRIRARTASSSPGPHVDLGSLRTAQGRTET